MRLLTQIAALIAFNLRTLPYRLGSAAAAVFGIAGVVAVLVGILSISEGFSKVMTSGGSPDTAIVLRGGADSEMTSVLTGDDVNVIANAPGIARANGKALASPELFVIVDLPKRGRETPANVPFRGVRPEAFIVRPEVKIVDGRMFAWGRNEVIVGKGAHASFGNTDIGTELRFGQNRWTVVGIFDAEGAISESELWTDAAVLAPAYRRGNSFQSAVVKLASPGSFQQFKDALTTDPKLTVRVMREADYYAAQSDVLRKLITFLAVIICGLMGRHARSPRLRRSGRARVGDRRSVAARGRRRRVRCPRRVPRVRRVSRGNDELRDVQSGGVRIRCHTAIDVAGRGLRGGDRRDRRLLPRNPRGKNAGVCGAARALTERWPPAGRSADVHVGTPPTRGQRTGRLEAGAPSAHPPLVRRAGALASGRPVRRRPRRHRRPEVSGPAGWKPALRAPRPPHPPPRRGCPSVRAR
jgi:putative ABC transport system permease protein